MAVQKEWFSVQDAAEYLGVSRRTIYKLTQDERLQAYVLGGQRVRRFKKADLDRTLHPLLATTPLTPFTDPLLEDLWSNDRDAAYDDL